MQNPEVATAALETPAPAQIYLAGEHLSARLARNLGSAAQHSFHTLRRVVRQSLTFALHISRRIQARDLTERRTP